MDTKITEKLQDQKFANELVKAKDEAAVKQLFSNENISITDSDMTELENLFQNVAKKLQKLPEAEVGKIAAGHADGMVYYISRKIADWADDRKVAADSVAEKFFGKLSNNSDKVVEGTLAVALVGATVGAQKLYHYASKNGWWIGHKK